MKQLILFSLLTFVLMTNAAEKQPETATAIFAGGCFWCMEKPYDAIDGVLSTTSGYTGGKVINPRYKEVSSGSTGHTEALRVVYDPSRVSYQQLLEVFWRNIDPLDASGQFCDKGAQYRSAIFYLDDKQQKLAEISRDGVAKKLNAKIVTEITAASEFYPAEDYHQDYYKKNPVRYKFYRFNCGRDKRLEALWGQK